MSKVLNTRILLFIIKTLLQNILYIMCMKYALKKMHFQRSKYNYSSYQKCIGLFYSKTYFSKTLLILYKLDNSASKKYTFIFIQKNLMKSLFFHSYNQILTFLTDFVRIKFLTPSKMIMVAVSNLLITDHSLQIRNLEVIRLNFCVILWPIKIIKLIGRKLIN